jgi:hypothetical protein
MIEQTAPDSFLPELRNELKAFSPIPVCWAVLSAGEVGEQLGHLTDWVNWLTDRYTLDHRTVPPCWDDHGAVLEELSALRTAWITAYSGDSVGDAPLRWHAEFAFTRQRLNDWVARTGCRPGEHRDPP